MSIQDTDFDKFLPDQRARVMRALANPSTVAPCSLHPRVFDLVTKFGRMGQRSDEWYKSRRALLTASDVAAAIGTNPYCTRHELLARKVAALHTNGAGSAQFCEFALKAMAHGEHYEDEAAREYYSRYPDNGVLYQCGLATHPVYTFLGGSPDRITTNGILLEIKVGWLVCL